MSLAEITNKTTDHPVQSLPAQTGQPVGSNTQENCMLNPQDTAGTAVSNPMHRPWCDESTDHAPADDGQWHVRKLGLIPTVENDLAAEEDERPSAPFEVEVSTRDGDPAPHAVLAIEGWAEVAVFDLDGVRRARDLFAEAARLLGDDDGLDAAAVQALALVAGGR